MIKTDLNNLYEEQLSNWTLAANNFKSLASVKTKELTADGIEYVVQFNPARIVSSAAKVDTKSIQERKCFLCAANRPAEQRGIEDGKYTILLNPFPIFPQHLTIPDRAHVDQKIEGRMGDMLHLAKELDDYVIFYNGPKCGASAPDHMHFQAGNKGFLPIEMDIATIKKELLLEQDGCELSLLADAPRNSLLLKGKDQEKLSNIFDKLYKNIPFTPEDIEPMLNLLAWYDEGEWYIILFLRKKHRPSCYYEVGNKQFLSSPASVDLGGVFITPVEKDFNRLDATLLKEILTEVSLSRSEVLDIINQLKSAL